MTFHEFKPEHSKEQSKQAVPDPSLTQMVFVSVNYYIVRKIIDNHRKQLA